MAATWNGPFNPPGHRPSKGMQAIGIGISTPDNVVLLIGIGYYKTEADLSRMIDDLIAEQGIEAAAAL